MTAKAVTEFENAELNERTHESRLNAVGNIYFLFSNNKLKYIGQRQTQTFKYAEN